MPHTDYTDCTGYRVVFNIWPDNVNVIRQTTLCVNIFIVLLYSKCCIIESFFIILTENANSPMAALNLHPPIPDSGGYFFWVRTQVDWIKEDQESAKKDTLMTVVWMPLSFHKLAELNSIIG